MRYINFENKPLVSADNFFMAEAIKEAKYALKLDEVPIGAVIVLNGKIIGRGHNLTERLKDVTAHAEMLAFTAAANYLGAKYLKECTLYVTIEPCVMCAGASYWTQIARLVYGAADIERGFSRRGANLLHPKTTVLGGVHEDQCAKLVKQFFLSKRNKFDI